MASGCASAGGASRRRGGPSGETVSGWMQERAHLTRGALLLRRPSLDDLGLLPPDALPCHHRRLPGVLLRTHPT